MTRPPDPPPSAARTAAGRPTAGYPTSAAPAAATLIPAGPPRPRGGAAGGLAVGGALVALLVATALLSLVWTPHDSGLVDSANRLQPPSWTHWLGTDRMGRDIVSRLMVGARTTLSVGVLAVLAASLVGVPLGVWAAMARGWVSDIVLRASDILFALPALLLAILLVAVRGASVATATAAIALAALPVFVRIAHGATLGVMAQDYIDAARLSGAGRLAIGWRHVLPNIAPVLGVQASAAFSTAILAEAGLSYLGLAAPMSTPTWGRMMRDGQAELFMSPWPALLPGLVIAVTVLGFNLVGDGLRDHFDPRLREFR
ncbi:MAG: ABC transporter permease [Propionibacteriaceae bacterium]|jgi:peptide/nickel transport system permease protein|nr:ABC transporter permease [Propionibacteriaceae bacterium]